MVALTASLISKTAIPLYRLMGGPSVDCLINVTSIFNQILFIQYVSIICLYVMYDVSHDRTNIKMISVMLSVP